MHWDKLIFSDNKQVRLLRHLMFWLAWGSYFIVCDYLFRQPMPSGSTYPASRKSGYVILGTQWIVETLLLVCLYAGACYVFIYALLPLLIKGRTSKAVVNTVLLCLVLYISAWFMYWNLFPFIDSLSGPYKINDYFAWYWPPLYLGIINAGKVISAAAIIKYVKYWWTRQKEKENLEKQKMIAELQLLKAQIRPAFLFNALNGIRDHSLNGSPVASESLLKLSELLSYMLYECNSPIVPLDKEITMMEKYMEMEKARLGESFEMGINIRGKVLDRMIAPFLLLPFIENSFKQTSELNGNGWITMDVGMEENLFFMKLVNGIVSDQNKTAEQGMHELSNVQKRLTLIYPRHELNMYAQQEMLITHLRIQLNDLTGPSTINNEKKLMEESR